MTQPTKQPRQVALQMSAIQAAILAVFFILVWIFFGWSRAYAFLMGGLCAWIPAVIQALTFYNKRGAEHAKKFVSIFFASEFLKLIISAILVAMVVAVLKLSMPFVLAGFVVTLMAFFVGITRLI